LKRLSLFFVLTLTSLSACTLFTVPLSVEQRTSELPVQQSSIDDGESYRAVNTNPTLRVLSLNMAHGRNDSFSQLFITEEEIRKNLAQIIEFLKRENADIVTLQEADEASSWSGNFDHVELLAREAGYAWYTHASHVDSALATYGTAVLSRFPIRKGFQVDFNPTPPTTRKGFTLAEIEWFPGTKDGKTVIIDVVSVHLDFARRSKRIEQVQDMKEVLRQRSNPAIVLGDFNSNWVEGDQELQGLSKVRTSKTWRRSTHLKLNFS